MPQRNQAVARALRGSSLDRSGTSHNSARVRNRVKIRVSDRIQDLGIRINCILLSTVDHAWLWWTIAIWRLLAIAKKNLTE